MKPILAGILAAALALPSVALLGQTSGGSSGGGSSAGGSSGGRSGGSASSGKSNTSGSSTNRSGSTSGTSRSGANQPGTNQPGTNQTGAVNPGTPNNPGNTGATTSGNARAGNPRSDFRGLDSNGDGVLSQTEFGASSGTPSPGATSPNAGTTTPSSTTPTDLSSRFRDLDSNGDGQISNLEYARVPFAGEAERRETNAPGTNPTGTNATGVSGTSITGSNIAGANADAAALSNRSAAELGAIFRTLDSDRDGILSQAEFALRGSGNANSVLPKVDMFLTFDADRSGTLTQSEFIASSGASGRVDPSSVNPPSTGSTPARAPESTAGNVNIFGPGDLTAPAAAAERVAQFRQLDRDSDGTLTLEEYEKMLTQEPAASNPSSQPRALGAPPIQDGTTLFRGLDINGDGRLSQTEFVGASTTGIPRGTR